MTSPYSVFHRTLYLLWGVVALLLPAQAKPQLFPPVHYPAGYFRYPVDARIGIAADYGELRPNHYHMGLDCRTNQVQNRPVMAAAGGFVSHVRIEPFGFGRAIYIQHPNGLTTVYGHLNRFFPALERYVKDRQYQLKSWEVFLDIPAGRFPVAKGQLIAYSGSTGGSLGPHCHFEIRDTRTNKVLNPLLFGLPIPDHVPPTLVRLAVYDRNMSTYSQKPRLYPLQKTSGGYRPLPSTIVVPSDRVSFGISAFDRVSGSSIPTGIFESVLYVDQKPVMGFRIDSMTYVETRYVNGNIDYRTRAAGGPFIQHLSRLPGCPEGIYRDFSGDGVITLRDHRPHRVKVVVKDAAGNSTGLNFWVEKASDLPDRPLPRESDRHDPLEFKPGNMNIFSNDRLDVFLGPRAIYDSFAFAFRDLGALVPGTYSDLLSVESGLVPLQDSLTLRIRATEPVPEILEGHMLIRRTWEGESEVVRAVRQGDWYEGKFRNFGNFQLVADQEPPIIGAGFREGAHLSRASRLVIYARDAYGPLRKFTGELDGKWLLFSNDKQKAFIYNFDAHCPPGRHTLRIIAEDQAGNAAERTWHFTR
ncbi:MAG: M23 family metallopeptidase [Bacteroidota bacterium]|nr:M23 family metallopeptidase [Bacteroidota bacterium]